MRMNNRCLPLLVNSIASIMHIRPAHWKLLKNAP
jgi:hypothetical protein